jgi:O-antigen ligase
VTTMARSSTTPSAADAWRVLVALSLAACLGRISPTLAPYTRVTLALLVAQFGFLLAASVVAWLSRPQGRPPMPPVVRWLVGITALSCTSLLWTYSRSATVEAAGALVLLVLFLTATALFRWREHTTALADVTFLYRVIVVVTIVGLLLALVGLSAMYGGYNRWQGLAANPNYAGMLTAAAIPIGFWRAVSRGRRDGWPDIAGVVVLSLGLALSGSRGAAAAAVLALIGVLVVSRHHWRDVTAIGLLVTMVALTVLFAGGLAARIGVGGGTGSSTSSAVSTDPGDIKESTDLGAGRLPDPGSDLTSGRLAVWKALGSAARERPVLGWGFGTTQLLPGTQGLSAHNILLLVAVELGLAGLLAFGALLVTAMRQARWRLAPGLTGAALAVLLVEMTESSLLGAGGPTATFFWLVVLAWGVRRGEHGASDE